VVLSFRRSRAAPKVFVFVIALASFRLGQKTSHDARRC